MESEGVNRTWWDAGRRWPAPLPFCPRGGGGLGEGCVVGLGEGAAAVVLERAARWKRIDGAARWKLKGRGVLANEFCDRWAINFNLPSPSS
jgi:hypothetical protein